MEFAIKVIVVLIIFGGYRMFTSGLGGESSFFLDFLVAFIGFAIANGIIMLMKKDKQQ